MSHALGDAFSPFLVGVLSDWIRPALKPLDTTVPIVNVSANVLPYGAPIFNNDDMVILQPHAVLPGVVYPTRYSQGQFIQFVYFSTGSWPHPARIWHWIPQSSVRSLLILLLPGTKPMVSDKDALVFLKLHSDISVWLLRGCIDLITDVQLMQTIFSDIRRVFLPVDVILRAEGQS